MQNQSAVKRLLLFFMVALFAVALPACNTKKRQAEIEAAERLKKTEQVKARLNSLLYNNSMSLDEKEKELAEIKAMNIDDQDVRDLIVKVEDKLREDRRQRELRDKAERDRLEQEKLKEDRSQVATRELADYFVKIAGAASIDEANRLIAEGLVLFESDQVPVLIVISKTGGNKDYDRPTTIRRYFDFIKDQKKYTAKFENLNFNSNGKITELELLK